MIFEGLGNVMVQMAVGLINTLKSQKKRNWYQVPSQTGTRVRDGHLLFWSSGLVIAKLGLSELHHKL